MSVPAQLPTVDERLDMLDGLIYADGFDCAATLDELCRYSRTVVGPHELEAVLQERTLRAVVAERDGMYCLSERPGLLAERRARIARARRLRARARRVARLLRHVPFVRGLLLTGSVAADNARAGADVDILVIVARERLGLVFLVLGSASRLVGRRMFCPNYYLCEGHLEVGPRTLYVAREVAQATGLVGDAAVLRQANAWVGEVLPAASNGQQPGGMRARVTRLQRILERPLRGALGGRLEQGARRLAQARLQAHYAAVDERVPAEASAALAAGTALRFHRGGRDERALERHAATRARLSQQLERLDARSGA